MVATATFEPQAIAERPGEMSVSLFPKQSLVFQSRASEILFGGAAGPGKSHLLRVLAVAVGMGVHKANIFLFRNSYGEIDKIGRAHV